MKILKLDRLFDSFSQYLEDRIALLKIELEEEFVKAIVKLSITVVSFLLFSIFLLFFSIFIGNLLNEIWKSSYLGQGAVALFYLLLFIISYIVMKKVEMRKSVEEYIMEKWIKKVK